MIPSTRRRETVRRFISGRTDGFSLFKPKLVRKPRLRVGVRSMAASDPARFTGLSVLSDRWSRVSFPPSPRGLQSDPLVRATLATQGPRIRRGNILWKRAGSGSVARSTTQTIFPKNTPYYGLKRLAGMINYRVDNLDALLAHLRRALARVHPHQETGRTDGSLGLRVRRGIGFSCQGGRRSSRPADGECPASECV